MFIQIHSFLGVFLVIAAANGLDVTPACHGQDNLEFPKAVLKIVETVNVPAEVAGALAELNVREGDVVSKNQMLARIRSDEAKLKLDETEIEYQVARAHADNDIDVRFAAKSHEVATAELQRSIEANNRVRDTISKSELDRLRLVQERTKLEIEQAEKNHQIHELNVSLKENLLFQRQLVLRRHDILAPIDGMVVAVNRRRGEWVNISDDVARIVRIDRLRVENLIPVSNATTDLVGSQVTFQPDLPLLKEQSFAGKIVFVSPEANPVNAKVRVWAEIENRDLKLRPGLKGTLRIQSKPKSADGVDSN